MKLLLSLESLNREASSKGHSRDRAAGTAAVYSIRTTKRDRKAAFPLDRAFQKSLVFPLSCSFGMTLVVSSILKGWTPAGPVLRLSE